MYPKDDSALKSKWLVVVEHCCPSKMFYLICHHRVDSELWVPVCVGCPTRGHEGSVGGLPLLVVVDDEPVVMSVAVELRCDSSLEPVDDLAIFPCPARQTAFQGMVTKDVDPLTSR